MVIISSQLFFPNIFPDPFDVLCKNADYNSRFRAFNFHLNRFQQSILIGLQYYRVRVLIIGERERESE